MHSEFMQGHFQTKSSVLSLWSLPSPLPVLAPSSPVVPRWRRALDPYWEMSRSHGLLSATETSLATA